MKLEGTNDILDPVSVENSAPNNMLAGISGFNVDYFNF